MPEPTVLLAGRDRIVGVASAAQAKPRALRAPVVTPKLSSYWLRLVTRADPRVAAALVEGLRTDLLNQEPSFWRLMPDHRPAPFDEAARLALEEEAQSLSDQVRQTEAWIRRLLSP